MVIGKIAKFVEKFVKKPLKIKTILVLNIKFINFLNYQNYEYRKERLQL